MRFLIITWQKCEIVDGIQIFFTTFLTNNKNVPNSKEGKCTAGSDNQESC